MYTIYLNYQHSCHPPLLLRNPFCTFTSCFVTSWVCPGPFVWPWVWNSLLYSVGLPSGYTTEDLDSLFPRVLSVASSLVGGLGTHEFPIPVWWLTGPVWVTAVTVSSRLWCPGNGIPRPFSLASGFYIPLTTLLRSSRSLRDDGLNVLFRTEHSAISLLLSILNSTTHCCSLQREASLVRPRVAFVCGYKRSYLEGNWTLSI